MPLILIEYYNEEYLWGLWQISESADELINEVKNYEKVPEKILSAIDKRKREWAAARILLKQIVDYQGKQYTGTCYNETGCPVLVNSEDHISISHSNEFVSVIVNTRKKVGIDIELINEKVLRVRDKFLSEREISEAGDKVSVLSTYWAIKEAIFKLYSGYSLNFRDQIYVHRVPDVNFGEIEAEVYIENQVKLKMKFLRYRDYIITYNH
ncbi:MAG: 4'-phosphopantetheinyl transferase family protein [Cytophagaceae bacterium]